MNECDLDKKQGYQSFGVFSPLIVDSVFPPCTSLAKNSMSGRAAFSADDIRDLLSKIAKLEEVMVGLYSSL